MTRLKSKTLLIVILLSFNFSCSPNLSSSKMNECIIGVDKKNKNPKINIDSLYIVTPGIEITNHKVHQSYFKDFTERDKIKNFIIEIEKRVLKNKEHYKLDIMDEDYLTINSVLEGPLHIKNSNPSYIIKVKDELISKNIKYSLLISIVGYYGTTDRYVMYISIINNSKKTLEKVDRYEFEDTPLDYNKLESRILRGIKRILN